MLSSIDLMEIFNSEPDEGHDFIEDAGHLGPVTFRKIVDDLTLTMTYARFETEHFVTISVAARDDEPFLMCNITDIIATNIEKDRVDSQPRVMFRSSKGETLEVKLDPKLKVGINSLYFS